MNRNFTEEEFNREIINFRNLFGNTEFWKKPEEIRDLAVNGISHVYFNTTKDGSLSSPTHEEIERWRRTFDNVMIEYNRREHLIQMHKHVETRPDCPECKRPQGVALSKKDGNFYCHMHLHPSPVLCFIEENV